MSSEKVSFNISVVDLGKIHILVEKGVYTNRTDFITKAIQNELNRNLDVINDTKAKNDFSIGIFHYSKSELEKIIEKKEMISIFNIGMIIISKDVDLNLAIAAIKEIKVFGKFVGSAEIRKHFNI